MKNKRILAWTLISMLLLSACGGTSAPVSTTAAPTTAAPTTAAPGGASTSSGTPSVGKPAKQEIATIVGGTTAGTYYVLASAIANILNQNYSESFKASATTASGTPNIMQLLQDNEAEFGFGQTGAAGQAYHGTGTFDRAHDNVASIMFAYTQPIQFLVNKDSGIEKIEDIRGKRYSVSGAGSGSELNARDIFGFYDMNYVGVSNPPFIVEYTEIGQAGEQMDNKQLDGVMLSTALGASGVLEIMSRGHKLISIDEEVIQKLIDLDPSYMRFVIAANTYPNQPEDVITIAIPNYLFCRKNLSEEMVYWFTDAVYKYHDDLVMTHGSAVEIVPESTGLGMTVPLHPGAIKWFVDNGYEVLLN